MVNCCVVFCIFGVTHDFLHSCVANVKSYIRSAINEDPRHNNAYISISHSGAGGWSKVGLN